MNRIQTSTAAAVALSLMLALGTTAQARKLPAKAATAAATAGATVAVLAKDKQGKDIVAYFSAPDADTNAEAVPQPAAGGFYRVLLGKDAKGCYRFEDHYQDSGNRQGVGTTCAADDLSSWALDKPEGKMTLYRPSGQGRSESQFKNGRNHGVDRYYDDQGKVRMSVVWQNGQMHGPFKLRDPSGKRLIEGVARDGDITRIKATTDGKALSREAALELLDEAQDGAQGWWSDMYR